MDQAVEVDHLVAVAGPAGVPYNPAPMPVLRSAVLGIVISRSE